MDRSVLYVVADKHLIGRNPNLCEKDELVNWQKIDEHYEIGSGGYATVYQHPSKRDRVVKVVRGSDAGYECYLKHIRSSKPNKSYPRIYNVRQFRNRLVIEMEKLAPIEDHFDQHEASSIIGDLLSEYHSRSQTRSEFKRDEKRALKELRELERKHDLCEDISCGNVLYRPSDDHLVFTDPFCK